MKKIWETLVVDKSGSMSNIRQQVVTTINERIQQAKQNSQDGDEVTVNIITFDGNVYENTWGTKAIDVPEATTGDYNPNGGTALYDAIGYTLKKIEKTCQDPEVKHLVVVITDGEDTSSTHFGDTTKLKNLITEHQNGGRVTVSYVGCDAKKVMKESEKLGIPASNCAAWNNSNTRMTEAAFKNLNSKLYTYYDNTKNGLETSNLFSTTSASSDSSSSSSATVDDLSEESVNADAAINSAAILNQLKISPRNTGMAPPMFYGIANSCCYHSNDPDCVVTVVAGNYNTKKANWDEIMA